MKTTKAAFAALCMVLIGSTGSVAQGAEALALKGYDPVAYFVDGKPVKGSPAHQHDWDDARYQFSSAKHRATIVADPERYAPQFGALCATGLSKGKQIEADPKIWRIVDGRLYIFSSAKAREMADQDPATLERTRQAHLQKK
jgi:hypothetical protein